MSHIHKLQHRSSIVQGVTLAFITLHVKFVTVDYVHCGYHFTYRYIAISLHPIVSQRLCVGEKNINMERVFERLRCWSWDLRWSRVRSMKRRACVQCLVRTDFTMPLSTQSLGTNGCLFYMTQLWIHTCSCMTSEVGMGGEGGSVRWILLMWQSSF